MLRQTPAIAFPVSIRDFLDRTGGSNSRGSVSKFEQYFTEAFDLNDCMATSSGRAALALALMALKEDEPDKKDVIIPAYTCPTIPISVAKAGLNVRLCDISLETLNIDTCLLEQVIDKNTLCVIAVHSFGFPCDMENIIRIAGEKKVSVVEDVAQSAGAKWEGRKLGSLGHFSCFSLGRGKSFTTYEGGVLGVGNTAGSWNKPIKPLGSPNVAHSLSTMFKLTVMSFLQEPHAWWFISKLPLGFEQQYHSLDFPIRGLGRWQGAFGLSVLQRLNAINAIRRSNGRYLAERLRDVKDVFIPKELDGAEAVYLRLPVVFKDRETREEMYRQLSMVGIGTSRAYVNPLNRYDYLSEIVPRGDYPAAEYVAERILALPTHPLMSRRDLDTIVDVFRTGGFPG